VRRAGCQREIAQKIVAEKGDYVLAVKDNQPKLPKEFTQSKKWAVLKAIGLACRLTRHADGSETHETRYYITSCYLSGERFAKAVRGHWAIENSLHWVLDVTYNEDQSRARDRHLADNLAWLRRMAIGLLKQHSSNHSIKGKQQMAGWSPGFMTEVLAGTGG